MNTTYNETILLGVPHYQQGDADNLCVFYAMSMVLVALYPEFHRKILKAPRYRREGSPVFQMLRQRARDDMKFKEQMADWFFKGMTMNAATSILNNLFCEYYKDSKETYFIHHQVKSKRVRKRKHHTQLQGFEDIWNVGDICTALSLHLPVIISGGGLPNHAVVAIGWEKESRLRRIIYYDPGYGRESWAYTRDIFYDDCDAIVPNWKNEYFKKHRPPALITHDKLTVYEEWDPEMWRVK